MSSQEKGPPSYDTITGDNKVQANYAKDESHQQEPQHQEPPHQEQHNPDPEHKPWFIRLYDYLFAKGEPEPDSGYGPAAAFFVTGGGGGGSC